MPATILLPDNDTLRLAADRLRDGGLVAFPTETVYGLGANAYSADAVAQIYVAKGRPRTNPLIVHVSDTAAIRPLVAVWTNTAQRLAEAFLPGALTLVLPRSSLIGDHLTAGGDTVAVRVPSHPVALALLNLVGLPIAAPSANRSEQVSPTTADHVAQSLSAYVEDLLILDGGASAVGLESTVLDLSDDARPRILRHGMITAQMLAQVVDGVTWEPSVDMIARSPGQSVRHYAPRATLIIAQSTDLPALLTDGDILITHNADRYADNLMRLPNTAAGYAADLYNALHTADRWGARRIVVEYPPTGDNWAAIHDRLRRAAYPKANDNDQ